MSRESPIFNSLINVINVAGQIDDYIQGYVSEESFPKFKE